MGYYNKELADIGFEIYTPSEKLAPYIYNYWSISTDTPKVLSNKILSDGSLGFIFNFAKPFKIEVNEKSFFCEEVTLCGQTQYPTFMYFEKILDAIGIRFKAGAAYLFFDEPLNSFANENLDFFKSSQWNFSMLFDNLKKTQSKYEKIVLLEAFLLKRLSYLQKKQHPKLNAMLQSIQKLQGDINVEELSCEFGISTRSIERIFKKELGLSVKLYARILRLRNARDMLSSLKPNTLTSVGYDTGFFDQAHFIKEFRHFMVETPKSYFEHKQKMAQELNYKQF